MTIERQKDTIERYGEIFTQKSATAILSVTPRTVFRMRNEGRLRRVGNRVDVRSIAEYIENPNRNQWRNEFMPPRKGGPDDQVL